MNPPQMNHHESDPLDNDYLHGIESTLSEWHSPQDEEAYSVLVDAVSTHESRRTPMNQSELTYQQFKQLPAALAAKVLDFVQFLQHKQAQAQTRTARLPGSAKGQIWVADDFDAPLDDFKAYQ